MSELTPEEKKKIYEEEKARSEAQEKIKKESEAKKTKTGCLGLIGLLVLIVVVVWICGVFDTKKKPEKKELINPASWAKIESSVQTSIQEKLIEKLDIQQGKVWIKEATWAFMNAETKENMAIIFATYCAVKKNEEYRSIEIIGWQTAKKLASYTSLGVFKVY